MNYPKILHPNDVNVNPSILYFYVHNFVPRITKSATLSVAAANRARGIVGEAEFDDDGNYGSAATIDVEILQAISKRVHYGGSVIRLVRVCADQLDAGKFVSESKFQAHPSDFIPHILKPDRKALEALITKPEVERALLARLRKKATLYARELDMQGEPLGMGTENGKAESTADEQRTAVKGVFRVDVDTVEQLYENYIIPLTKEVEVSRLRVSQISVP